MLAAIVSDFQTSALPGLTVLALAILSPLIMVSVLVTYARKAADHA